MKRLLTYLGAPAVAALVLLGVMVSHNDRAEAQAGAACPIATMSPVSTSSTSITLTANDNCKVYVTTSGSSVTVTLPATLTVPAGWHVWVKADGAGTASVTPSTGTLDGLATAVAITQGKSNMFVSDHTNYFSLGLGIAHP